MAERKLPVYASLPDYCSSIPGADGTRRLRLDRFVFGLDDINLLRKYADWLERANGIAPKRQLQCRECRHWLEYGTPVGPDFKSVAVGHECTKGGGLESPPGDGSGFCSYAEPRESEGENG